MKTMCVKQIKKQGGDVIEMPAEETIERLMNEYGDAVFRMCCVYLKDYHLAEDAAQDTFIKAMYAWDSFRHQSSEKTWITRIAINCCKNMMRTNWFRMSRNELKDEARGKVHGNGDPLEKIAEQDSVTGAVMKLNVNDRQLILLYYYQELSMKEIAEITGKSENTVIQRVSRARKRLRKLLEEAGYDT